MGGADQKQHSKTSRQIVALYQAVKREQFETEAFEHAEPFNQRFYTEGKERGGSLFKMVQRKILLGYFGSQSATA